jgi:hypothetical protein
MNRELESLAQRITSLEAQNAKLVTQSAWMKRMGAFAALVVLSGAVLMGAAPPNATLEAKRFVVKDDAGNVKAFLDADQGHGRIWLYDENNVARLFVGAAQGDPSLSINSGPGKTRIKLGVDGSGPYYQSLDANGAQTFKKP